MKNHIFKKKKSEKTILSVGAEMRGSFSLFIGGVLRTWYDFGDLTFKENWEEYKMYLDEATQDRKVDVIICDKHPSYVTTRLAEEIAKEKKAKLVKVQHHVAHGYSVVLEHGLKDFIAISCDGLGYGDDEKIWGGEVFDTDKRVGSLQEQLQLGGDAATVDPRKMVVGILAGKVNDELLWEVTGFDQPEFELLLKQAKEKYHSIMTTSCGRVLDAVSCLLGFSQEKDAALELEKYAKPGKKLKPVIEEFEGRKILNTDKLFLHLIKNMKGDRSEDARGKLAWVALAYIAEGLYDIAKSTAGKGTKGKSSEKKRQIVFSGGVAYNKIIRDILLKKKVIVNKEIECGDDGVSFGQIGWCLKR